MRVNLGVVFGPPDTFVSQARSVVRAYVVTAEVAR
jgi:hypothetical protein